MVYTERETENTGEIKSLIRVRTLAHTDREEEANRDGQVCRKETDYYSLSVHTDREKREKNTDI